jgi:bifunctional DNase/RNase
MQELQVRDGSAGDRGWEHHLLPVLVTAFAIAAGATLFSTPVSGAAALAPGKPPPLAPAPLPSRAAPLSGFVAMTVVDVIEQEGDGEGVVLLADGTSEVVLPLFVDSAGVTVVREGLAFNGGATPRTGGLLGASLEALGADLVRVEVDLDESDASRARLVLVRDGVEVFVRSSPSEALALALVRHAPVFTAESCLQSRGIQRTQVRRRPGALPSNLKSPERL